MYLGQPSLSACMCTCTQTLNTNNKPKNHGSYHEADDSLKVIKPWNETTAIQSVSGTTLVPTRSNRVVKWGGHVRQGFRDEQG